MPFNLNNTEINAMTFNNVVVEKAYLNGTLVFSKEPTIGDLYEGGYYIGDNKVCTNRALLDIVGKYDKCVSEISGTINGYNDWYLPSISELEVLYSLKDTFTTLGIWDYYDMEAWASDADVYGIAYIFHMGTGKTSRIYKTNSRQGIAFRSIV